MKQETTRPEPLDGPLLSVVIPIYNVTSYLDQCISSVTSQGFAPGEIEIILVDDGSTDGSNLIAEKWARRNPDVIIVHRTNGGLSAARNSGLDVARGEFLTFLDSDDIVPDGAYRQMIFTLQESGSDFITAGPYRFSWWDRHAKPFARNADLFSSSATGLNLESNPEYLRDFTAWNKVYKRSFFVQSGVRFPEGRIYEDVATSPLLYRRARAFDVHAGPGLFWRVTPGGITQTIKPVKAIDRLWALDHVQQLLSSEGASQRVFDEFGFAVLDYNLRWVFLEYHRFDDQTRALILDEAERLLAPVPDSIISRVQSPLSEWGRLAKQGKRDELAAILESPSLQLPDLPIQTTPDSLDSSVTFAGKQQRVKTQRFRERQSSDLQRRLRNLFLYLLLRPVAMSLPLMKNTAVFSAYWGSKFSPSDGPAAICLELNRLKPSFMSIVFASQSEIEKITESVNLLATHPERIKVVRNGSLSSYFYLWRAKYLFNDVNFQLAFRLDRGTKKRRGQIEVQTTHGVPIKKMGLDSAEAIPPEEQSVFVKRSRRYDYLVSTSPTVAKTFANAHSVNPTILKTGLPQHDGFFTPPEADEIAAIKHRYGIDPAKRVVLYAPTFRNGNGSAFPYLLDIPELHEQLGDQYQLVLKPHPFNHTRLEAIDFRELTDYAIRPTASPFVKLMGKIRVDADYCPVTLNKDRARSKTRYSNIEAPTNDLLFAADLVISDYSSLMFGYTHLAKPLVLFTPDIEHYDSTRGSYFNIDQVAPGSVAKSTQEVIQAIQLAKDSSAWEEKYGSRRRAFMKDFLEWEEGGASGKVLREVGILQEDSPG